MPCRARRRGLDVVTRVGGLLLDPDKAPGSNRARRCLDVIAGSAGLAGLPDALDRRFGGRSRLGD
jgi:hypothetical protein